MVSEALYWLLKFPLAFMHIVYHCLLTIWYRGKGKMVPPAKNPLLLKSATELARNICEGKYKSEDVIKAYIDRILEVEPYINATVQQCFENALKKAKEVDEFIASGRRTKGELSFEKPLFGVPISVKMTFHVKDMPCTAGCLFYSHLKAIEDCPAVAALKKAGAIVITSTNIPELGLDIETFNKLYGRTCNPYDTNRTSGGSSGGEAALISAGASVLGLGSDLLGSLRIPAHFSGIFTHKPSRGLVSNNGTCPIERPDVPCVQYDSEFYKYITSGPMCRYAEDLVTSMKVLALDNEVRKKFDHQVDFKRVKIYYLREIKAPLVAPVAQEITSALNSAVSYFEKQYNIEAKEVKMPNLIDVNRCFMTVMKPVFEDYRDFMIGHKSLGLNEKLEFLKSLAGKSKICLNTAFKLSCISNPLITSKRHIYYQNMMDKFMDDINGLLDVNAVLLMPTFPVVAPYHSETFLLLPNICYTALFNVLGLPATQCPLGFNKKGLPYGIQIIGCLNNDALTIACAVELEKAFGGWKQCKSRDIEFVKEA